MSSFEMSEQNSCQLYIQEFFCKNNTCSIQSFVDQYNCYYHEYLINRSLQCTKSKCWNFATLRYLVNNN